MAHDRFYTAVKKVLLADGWTITHDPLRLQYALEDWQNWPGPESKFTVEIIADETRDRYIALTVGWDGYTRIHSVLFHVDIVDGKFWIQYDTSEDGIATQLIESGVPKNRIVLAFHPEIVREWGDFAVR